VTLRWPFNKNTDREKPSLIRQNSQKLPGPEKLPLEVARFLIVILGHNPAWVRGLKYVERPRAGIQSMYDVRVFDELATAAKRVHVINFNSLDDYPDLIIFEGWLNKDNGIALLR